MSITDGHQRCLEVEVDLDIPSTHHLVFLAIQQSFLLEKVVEVETQIAILIIICCSGFELLGKIVCQILLFRILSLLLSLEEESVGGSFIDHGQLIIDLMMLLVGKKLLFLW